MNMRITVEFLGEDTESIIAHIPHADSVTRYNLVSDLATALTEAANRAKVDSMNVHNHADDAEMTAGLLRGASDCYHRLNPESRASE